MRLRSLRGRLLLSSVLWTVGLLFVSAVPLRFSWSTVPAPCRDACAPVHAEPRRDCDGRILHGCRTGPGEGRPGIGGQPARTVERAARRSRAADGRHLSRGGPAARGRPERAARPTRAGDSARHCQVRRSRAWAEDAARHAGAGGRARPRDAGQHEIAAAIDQQVERMRRQVDYHLAHARAVASGATPAARSRA